MMELMFVLKILLHIFQIFYFILRRKLYEFLKVCYAMSVVKLTFLYYLDLISWTCESWEHVCNWEKGKG